MKLEKYWNKSLSQSKLAVKNGSLIPLTTKNISSIQNIDNNFEIREIAKWPIHNTKKEHSKPNPFSPWDKMLEISNIGKYHTLILNKFPVQLGHMLLITSKWDSQDSWLNINDWKALLTVDNDTTGLWFFNSCSEAGASQKHKHFQLLRRTEEEAICPRETWFNNHIDQKLTSSLLTSSISVSRRLYSKNNNDSDSIYSQYVELCEKMKLGNPKDNLKPKAPYNLLLTRDWMALIRRKRENVCGISINALGFAGYILITNNSNKEWIITNGIVKLLEQVVSPI